jgi:hypothetical protein
MKKSRKWSTGMALLGFGALAAFADSSPNTCSLATLQGTYAFSGTGTDSATAYSTSGRETYDGHGHIQYSQLWDEAGVTNLYEGTGTYTMDANCVAHATYGPNNHWTYYVAPDGSAFWFNNNNNTGIVSAGHEERIARAPLFSL